MFYDTHCRCFPRKKEFCAEKSLGKVTHITPLKTQCTFNVLNALRFLCKEHPLTLTNCIFWTYLSSRCWLRTLCQFVSQSWQTAEFGGQEHRRLWAHSLTFLNLSLLFHKKKIKLYLHHKTALNSKWNKMCKEFRAVTGTYQALRQMRSLIIY